MQKPGLTLGLILAGGRAQRMGQDKALVDVAGRPLLAHVMARLRPQLDALALSANGDPRRFAGFDLPVLADGTHNMGPLAGLLAGMDYARQHGMEWVAIVPVDAPLLPLDLIARLRASLIMPEEQMDAAMARGTHIEPLFSLWHIRCKAPLLAAARQGDYALFRLIGALKHVFTDFDGDQGFININSPEDIAAVRSLMPRQKDDGAEKAKRNDTEKESGSWQK